ncbi:MAG: MBOAT family O-acyltransferase [Lachnospiraceae bacterium]
MLFSSMLFLWTFLPIVLIGSRLLSRASVIVKNLFLLAASIWFYAWGEPIYVVLLLVSILLNFILGRILGYANEKENDTARRVTLIIAIVINLLILGYYKYFDFFIQTVNSIMGKEVMQIRNIALPIGISFFTFQALSYMIDLYRKEYSAQKNFIDLALYISFFPQLIAGPIVKYYEINTQLTQRTITNEKTAMGVRSFIYGLAKKVLIANFMGMIADYIYGLELSQVTGFYAWVGALCYMLQIYYDFSGYSDMAIGLGRMFGFEFPMNFDLPYISGSIQEFWRRWHISLGTWFREYVYIPLGGNRKGQTRTLFNLMFVFILTGAWHGASWNFVLWGLYYGALIVLERIGLAKILARKGMGVIRHFYTLTAVLFGWVLFRAEDLHQAGAFIKRMIMPWKYVFTDVYFWDFTRRIAIAAFVIGVLCSGPLQLLAERICPDYRKYKYGLLESIFCGLLLLLCMASLVANTYNPFIYFRF